MIASAALQVLSCGVLLHQECCRAEDQYFTVESAQQDCRYAAKLCKARTNKPRPGYEICNHLGFYRSSKLDKAESWQS